MSILPSTLASPRTKGAFVSSGRASISSVADADGPPPGTGTVVTYITTATDNCDQAPAMMIDDELYGKLDPDKIDEILTKYT